jgi:hypothetical protein
MLRDFIADKSNSDNADCLSSATGSQLPLASPRQCGSLPSSGKIAEFAGPGPADPPSHR